MTTLDVQLLRNLDPHERTRVEHRFARRGEHPEVLYLRNRTFDQVSTGLRKLFTLDDHGLIGATARFVVLMHGVNHHAQFWPCLKNGVPRVEWSERDRIGLAYFDIHGAEMAIEAEAELERDDTFIRLATIRTGGVLPAREHRSAVMAAAQQVMKQAFGLPPFAPRKLHEALTLSRWLNPA